MVKLSRIISRVADGDCLKDVSLQTSTENDPFQLFFGRLGSLVQPTKTQTNLPIYMSRKMFINLCCQGGFGHHGSQHGTLALDILRERRLTHLVAGGSICFPFFGQVSLPIVHRNCQIIAEGLGAFVSHTQKKLQLLGNTGKRETQIPNPLRGNRAITKEYNENFLINFSNLLQSKLNHQEKQDTLEKPQRARYKTSVRLIRWCPFRYLLRWSKRVTLLCQLRTQQGEPTKSRQNLEPWTLSN